jgi:MFS family permease
MGALHRRVPDLRAAAVRRGGVELVDGTLPLAVTMAAGGLAAGMLNPILTTVMYERIPDELRSRVAGAVTAGVLMTMPLGGLAAGYLIEQTGLATALLTLGGLYFLTTLAPAVFPRWREMDAGREPLRGPSGDGPPVSSPGPSRPAPASAATPPRP